MAEMVFECKFYQVHRANLFIFKGITQYCVMKFFGRNLVSYNLSSIYNCLGYKFALQCSHGPVLPIVCCRTYKGYKWNTVSTHFLFQVQKFTFNSHFLSQHIAR